MHLNIGWEPLLGWSLGNIDVKTIEIGERGEVGGTGQRGMPCSLLRLRYV